MIKAVNSGWSILEYIKNPYESVQEEGIKINYSALKFINSPSHSAEITAIKKNEAAISFINDLDKNKILELLKVNILVIKYVLRKISKEDIENVLKTSLSQEDVEDKYVRDFLNCSIIDRHSEIIPMDKVMFIYRYGSKKAKKIAVDEKLKIMQERYYEFYRYINEC